MAFIEFLGFVALGWLGLTHFQPNGQNNPIVLAPVKIGIIIVISAVLFFSYKYYEITDEHWDFVKEKLDSREGYCKYAKSYPHSFHFDEAEQACNAAVAGAPVNPAVATDPHCVGDCANGQGIYTFGVDSQWNGGKYIGETKDRKYNGQGIYISRSGEKYVGEWKDGNKNGQGTFTYANGDKYVGEFKDNKYNGQGIYIWVNTEKYIGEFKDNNKNGQGILTFGIGSQGNGNKYIGEFKDEKFNGQGTYTFANGEKYVGEWKDDKFVQSVKK